MCVCLLVDVLVCTSIVYGYSHTHVHTCIYVYMPICHFDSSLSLSIYIYTHIHCLLSLARHIHTIHRLACMPSVLAVCTTTHTKLIHPHILSTLQACHYHQPPISTTKNRGKQQHLCTITAISAATVTRTMTTEHLRLLLA